MTVTEPRFTPGETALLLASRRAEQAPRGSHGFLLSEAMDPKNQFAFRVPDPGMDWAAKALHDAQERREREYPNESMAGLMWRVEKRDQSS